MTDKSICAKCAELIRVRVIKPNQGSFVDRVCSLGVLEDVVGSDGTVLECSRFVEVPGEEAGVHGPDPIGKVALRRPRPRYLPHGPEE